MLRPQPSALPPVAVRLETPSIARVYDYFLGGTTNWVIDREFGDHVLDRFPIARRIALDHRLFLHRVVRYLMRQNVRQFLDIGAGVPSAGATHLVADEWAVSLGRRADARVVYVDNDPLAVAHTEIFLDRDGDRNRQAVVEADLRDPDGLWQEVLATELIDPDKPVALLLIAVLHLQQPDAYGHELGIQSVAKLRELLPAGSYIAISHVTNEGVPIDARKMLARLRRMYEASGSGRITCRSRAEIEAMLRDCRMIEPGWTSPTEWRPAETGSSALMVDLHSPRDSVVWAGVAEKL